MKLRAMLIVVAGLLVGADAKDDAIKKDKEKLQGSWKVVAGESDGKKESDKDIEMENVVFTFKGDKLIIKEFKDEHEGTFKLDPSQKPKAIDVMLKKDNKNQTIKGIYALDEDTLTICMVRSSGDPRPSEFATKKGSRSDLTKFKREKP